MFSTAGTSAVTGMAGFNCAMARMAPEHGRAAGHVVLHLLHAVGGLDGDAAGVEGDALADQSQMIAGFGRVAGL